MSMRTAMPALAAAVLFGASTPLAKWLVGQTPPLLLAGLLYLGSGLGLAAILLVRRATAPVAGTAPPRWPWSDVGWLLAAILAGGIVGPALLMVGLTRTSAASASLLLNLETVLTAAIAWWVFKENAGRRVVLGMAAIVVGGVLLSAEPGAAQGSLGMLWVVAACACWAIDNNLTRKVSAHDALLLACLKGAVAGSVNTGLAIAFGAALPPVPAVAASLLVGFFGYGLSLALFVVALRTLGTARTGAYFSVAPLFGVLLSLLLWPEPPPVAFWIAAALMAIGVWLHVSERHEHLHTHEPLEHTHRHRHDEHHHHEHAFAWDGVEPHEHAHRHEALTHTHAHDPDIHHRHSHPAA